MQNLDRLACLTGSLAKYVTTSGRDKPSTSLPEHVWCELLNFISSHRHSHRSLPWATREIASKPLIRDFEIASTPSRRQQNMCVVASERTPKQQGWSWGKIQQRQPAENKSLNIRRHSNRHQSWSYLTTTGQPCNTEQRCYPQLSFPTINRPMHQTPENVPSSQKCDAENFTKILADFLTPAAHSKPRATSSASPNPSSTSSNDSSPPPCPQHPP